MSDKQKIKKINIQRLEQIDRKASSKKLKRAILTLIILILFGIGGVGAHRLIGDNILASRIAVNKMTCPGCVITLKEVTGKIPGVIEADVSLAAQELTVRFYEKKTNPEDIQAAIIHAGYPAQQDGLFKQSGKGIDDVTIVTVDGKPIFRKDIHLASDIASNLFSLIGKRILLRAADEKQIVVQPHEIEKELRWLANEQGISIKDMIEKGKGKFGSVEKYIQVTGQNIGIRKLLANHILQKNLEPMEKEHKKTEWLAGLFMAADVRFLDSEIKERLQAKTGQDEWQRFWAFMISQDTELKRILSKI